MIKRIDLLTWEQDVQCILNLLCADILVNVLRSTPQGMP
jgi:hypothetical protein